MGALERFLTHGVRFQLKAGDAILAIGPLNDSLRADIKAKKAEIIHEIQWQEFDQLLSIVGPAYNTPDDEYPLIREAAARDLNGALVAFRDMAHQVSRQLPKPNGDI